jgi:hypothetical protein
VEIWNIYSRYSKGKCMVKGKNWIPAKRKFENVIK